MVQALLIETENPLRQQPQDTQLSNRVAMAPEHCTLTQKADRQLPKLITSTQKDWTRDGVSSTEKGMWLTLIELLSSFTFCSSCSRSCFKSELHLSSFCFSSSFAGGENRF